MLEELVPVDEPREANTMACATGLLYPSAGVLMVTPSMVHLPRPAYLAITLTAALFLQIN